jgi:hypothetical protein
VAMTGACDFRTNESPRDQARRLLRTMKVQR